MVRISPPIHYDPKIWSNMLKNIGNDYLHSQKLIWLANTQIGCNLAPRLSYTGLILAWAAIEA